MLFRSGPEGQEPQICGQPPGAGLWRTDRGVEETPAQEGVSPYGDSGAGQTEAPTHPFEEVTTIGGEASDAPGFEETPTFGGGAITGPIEETLWGNGRGAKLMVGVALLLLWLGSCQQAG